MFIVSKEVTCPKTLALKMIANRRKKYGCRQELITEIKTQTYINRHSP